MPQRFVPIVIQIQDGNSKTVVGGIKNAFQQLDEAAHSASSNGLKNALVQADLLSHSLIALKNEVVQAAQEYLQFNRNMANIDTLLDATANVNKLRDGLLELHPALGQTSELARGMYQAISSGVQAGQALTFIQESAKAARAGLASTFDTIDAGTSVMNAFGIEGKNITQVYDRMFQTVKLGKVEMPQLAASIGLVSGIAAKAGVSIDEMFAALATSTLTPHDEMFAALATSTLTLKPALAIEGMRSALSNIVKPSSEALQVADRLGITFNAAALKSKGLAQFLNEVSAAAKGDTGDLSKLFQDVQGLNFVLSITGNQTKVFNENLKNMSGAAGSVEEAFRKQRASIGAQLDEMKTAFQQTLMRVFVLFEPLISIVLTLLNKLAPITQAVTVATLGLGAAYLLLNTQIIASALTRIPQIIASLQTLLYLMTSLRYAAAMTATELVAVTAGWAAVAAAFIILGYAAYKYLSTEREIKTATDEQIKATQDSINAYREKLNAVNLATRGDNETIDRQKLLKDTYDSLDAASKNRIDALNKERGAVGALTDELNLLLQAKQGEQRTQIVSMLESFIKASDEFQRRTDAARQAQADLERAQQTGKVTVVGADEFGGPYQYEIEASAESYGKLRDAANVASAAELKSKETLDAVGKALSQVQVQSGLNIKKIYEEATAHKELGENVSNVSDKLGAYLTKQKDVSDAVNKAQEAVTRYNDALKHLDLSPIDVKNSREALNGGEVNGVPFKGLVEQTTNRLRKMVEEFTKRGSDNPFREAVMENMTALKDLDAQIKTTYGGQGQKAYKEFIATLPADTQKAIKQAAAFEGTAQSIRSISDVAREAGKILHDLQERIRTTNREINALSGGAGGQAFGLTVEAEKLDRVRSKVKEIFDLRVDLNKDIGASIPTGDIHRLEEIIAAYNREKQARDTLITTAREQSDAEMKLSVTARQAQMAVVDAQTRANTTYFENLRKRKDAEAQLTADLATEIRKRADFEQNMGREVFNAEAEALKDKISERTKQYQDLFKALALTALSRGDTFQTNPVVQQALKIAGQPANVSPVVQAISTTNDILRGISANIEQIKPSSAGTGGDGVALGLMKYDRDSAAPSKRAREVLSSVLRPNEWDTILRQAAATQPQINPDVLTTILKATLYRESGGRAGQVSEQNAGGYFQMLPGVARHYRVQNVNNKLQSAIGAAAMFADLYKDTGGDIAQMFTEYFGGPDPRLHGQKTRAYKRDQLWVYQQAMAQSGRVRPTGSARNKAGTSSVTTGDGGMAVDGMIGDLVDILNQLGALMDFDRKFQNVAGVSFTKADKFLLQAGD